MYIERLVDPLLDDLLAELPAVLLSGPRASGKTTTALRRAGDILRLDRPAVANAVRGDPDVALATHDGAGPLCIDEWQVVPEVLGAVKRAVDTGNGAGRFILTGSVAAEAGPDGWPATGRVVVVRVLGLVERETENRAREPSCIDVLFDTGPSALARTSDLTVQDYVRRSTLSGFPDARRLSPARRTDWLGSYIDQAVGRDAAILGGERDPRRLRRYLKAVGINTGGIVRHKALIDAAQITRDTALRYDALLEAIHLTEQVPPHVSNRLTQLVRTPKRVLVDPAMIGAIANVDERRVLRDADLLGRTIDTFVAAQLRAELVVSRTRAELQHLRDANGRHEVDYVLEATDGRIVGIEVRATATPRPDDAKHLRWLAEKLGDDLASAVVLHTGPSAVPLGDGIIALPISSLWR